jgi:hypothetical protein
MKKRNMSKKKYLTDDESECLKVVCETLEEQSIIRELLESGMKLDEVLNNKRARIQPYL